MIPRHWVHAVNGVAMRKFAKVLVVLLLVLAGLAGAGYLYFQSQLPQEPILAGDLKEDYMTFDDRERRYIAYMPASGQPDSILFMLHGSGSDPERSRSGMTYEFDVIADKENVLVVYPEGYENHWNDCRSALTYSATAENVDDVGFLVGLKDKLSVEYDIPASNVFVVGMSNGGHMTYRLAYEAPDEFEGFAVIASNIPAESNFGCTPSGQPVNMMIMTGTDDPINPYAGGEVTIFGSTSEGLVQTAQDSADYWAGLAGYGDMPRVQAYPDLNPDDESTVESQIWDGLPGARVTFMTVQGGGHAVPHPVTKYPPFFGPTNQDMNGPQEIWAFFQGGGS